MLQLGLQTSVSHCCHAGMQHPSLSMLPAGKDGASGSWACRAVWVTAHEVTSKRVVSRPMIYAFRRCGNLHLGLQKLGYRCRCDPVPAGRHVGTVKGCSQGGTATVQASRMLPLATCNASWAGVRAAQECI